MKAYLHILCKTEMNSVDTFKYSKNNSLLAHAATRTNEYGAGEDSRNALSSGSGSILVHARQPRQPRQPEGRGYLQSM